MKKLIQILKESNEWDWVTNTNPNFKIGDKFVIKGQNSTTYGKTVYRIDSIDGDIVTISWVGEEYDTKTKSTHPTRLSVEYNLDIVNKWINKDVGDRWELVKESLENDFDWSDTGESDLGKSLFLTMQDALDGYGYNIEMVGDGMVRISQYGGVIFYLNKNEIDNVDGIVHYLVNKLKAEYHESWRLYGKKDENTLNLKELLNIFQNYFNKILNESEDDGFDWIRDIKPRKSIHITELHPNDRYRIVELNGISEEEWYNNQDFNGVDIGSDVFKLDNDYNFSDWDDDYDYVYDNPDFDGDVWIVTDDGRGSSWINVSGIFVEKIEDRINESEDDDFDWIQNDSIDGKELRDLILRTKATTIPFKSVGGNLNLYKTLIKDLGNLQSVGGYLNLYKTLITTLGNLQNVNGDLFLEGTPIKDLGNLQSVNGDLFLYGTPIKDLGNLQSVGGDLDLRRTKIENLGNLQSVGSDLNLYKTPIKYLGNLQSVGGDLDLRGTQISRKYSEDQIRQMVNVGGDIYF